MAPEQLQGAEADTRTDVFGFGCVLYKMITGRRAFAGDTPASVIAAVLEHEPAPLAANSEEITHPALEAIIRTCLSKNPEDRWSSGHDVWLALRRLTPAGEPPNAARTIDATVPSSRDSMGDRRAVFGRRHRGTLPSFQPCAYGLGSTCHAGVIDFPNTWLVDPRLSPDGRYLALSPFGGGQDPCPPAGRWAGDMASGAEHALPLTWSPDSRSLAVLANGEIKAIDIATGAVRTIGRAPD